MKTKTFVLVAVAVFAVLVGGFAYVALTRGGDERSAGALVQQRAYGTGSWSLEIAGASAGALKSVEGCDLSAPAVKVAGGGKQPGRPRYGACRLTFGLGMSKATYQWIAAALNGNGTPKDLALNQTNAQGTAGIQLELHHAILTEFALPALDGGNPDPVYFTMEVTPEQIVKKSGSAGAGPLGSKAKQLTGQRFSLAITGVDGKDVMKVSPWSFEVPTQMAETGADKFGSLALGQPTFSDLTVEAMETPLIQTWDAWVKDWDDGKTSQKSAVLTINDLTGKPLVELNLAGVGLTSADLYGTAETSTAAGRRSYAMYTEGPSLSFPGAVTAG